MTERESGESLETQAEEASKDANVTVDEPTAPALDIEPDPNTEWEKAAADGSGSSDDDSKSESDEEDDSGQS
ncbi:MAG: hypothetical protein LC808_41135 [Actinobacteria bacterium]|nr:hypothetical protein [Actinomycetota bacterium]